MKRQQLDSFKLLEMLLMLSFAVTVPYDAETSGFIPLSKRDHKKSGFSAFFLSTRQCTYLCYASSI